ncbi:MAG: hypothetical protein QOJ09_1731, partial [Actinomycetota bacterium]|nr:hypothetical protein [Actinomycetota bacterium]
RDVGGFDDKFFAFFEDVDLGWRLWLLGHRVLYIPTSVVRHAHHGTMGKQAQWREDYLLERNAMFAMLKNLDDEHLPHALAAALLLSARRGFVYGEDASDHLDLSHGQDDDAETIQLHKRTVAPFLAMDQVAQSLPEVLASRAEIQARRVRDDHEIFRLVRHPMLSTTPDPGFTDVLQRLALLFGIPDLFAVRRKVAIVTGDALTTKLAGPGIRAVELAKILATEHDVRLATTSGPPDLEVPGVEVVPGAAPHDVRALEAWCDVLVFQGFLLEQHPWLRDSRRALVADLYDPFHLEQLEVDRNLPLEDRVENLQSTVRLLNVQLARGDFFLCASPRQRDFWLGQLAAVGRINPSTYDPDQGLHRLIGVVPFGIPAAPPRKTKPVLRGVVPGIGQADVIVFWGGGLYPWFDPGVLVRAIAQVRSSLPSVRLVFLGGAHPNPDVPAMTTADETRELAADLGLLGEHVFFVDEWVPYAERQEYLLEADIAVSTHLDHLETEFSFRTRVLDYLWAELPMILTSGDALSDLVEREGLGRVVPPGDVDAIASALEALAKDESARAVCRQRIREVSPRFEWSAVAAPLLEFCRDPRRAADLVSKLGPVEFQPPFPPPPGRRARLAGAVGLVRRSARDDGVRTTAERVIRKLRGRLPGLARHSHAP